mmetsp:Transcript_31990/g.74963  ORF Transcript_31990/g.74963 Transcript_31990/m.74963 type:complete len:448 (+) Transcript_31990:67-1410(+)
MAAGGSSESSWRPVLLGAAAGAAAASAVTAAIAFRRKQAPKAGRRWAVGEPLPRPAGSGSCVYLDVNATCPIYPDVADASAPFFREHWGNPSSTHAFGRPCRDAVAKARLQVATMIDAKPDEIVFCGCGSEADNWAILGALELKKPRRHIVTTRIEHPAILRCVEALVKAGKCDATYVDCDSKGYVDPQKVAAAVIPGSTALVSAMLANNEVGSVQDVAQMVALCKKKDSELLFHTDAAQACGKIDVHVSQLGVDLCTIVGHKYGAPKGIAAMYIRNGVKLPSMIRGGGQEAGRRAGTECVPLIVALGEASAIWSEQGKEIAAHMAELRDLLLSRLTARLGSDRIRVNGGLGEASDVQRPTLPNTLSVAVLGGAQAGEILASLSESVAASAGAACHSSHAAISEVLAAMAVPEQAARSTLRLSVGRHTTKGEIERAAELIANACQSK